MREKIFVLPLVFPQSKNETFKLSPVSFGGFKMENVCIFMSENIHWSVFINRYVPNSISSVLFIGCLLD